MPFFSANNLQLKTNITFTVEKHPACLLSGYVPEFGKKLHFVGYGQNPQSLSKNNSNSTDHSRELLLSVQSEERCQK